MSFIELWLISLAGIAVAGYAGWTIVRGKLAARWPTVPAEIARHRLERVDDEYGPTYVGVTAYRYRVDDRPYVSERVSFGMTLWTRDRDVALIEAESGLTVGKMVRAHVNPADPTDAVLDTSVTDETILYLAIGMFVASGGIYGLLSHLH